MAAFLSGLNLFSNPFNPTSNLNPISGFNLHQQPPNLFSLSPVQRNQKLGISPRTAHPFQPPQRSVHRARLFAGFNMGIINLGFVTHHKEKSKLVLF
jgi:hypothetical protein